MCVCYTITISPVNQLGPCKTVHVHIDASIE